MARSAAQRINRRNSIERLTALAAVQHIDRRSIDALAAMAAVQHIDRRSIDGLAAMAAAQRIERRSGINRRSSVDGLAE